MASSQLSIAVGDEVKLDSFLESLVSLGYERTERVEAAGEFSVRGGIVDLYPLTSPYPYRIEWFDDEIDSIRSFDATDQRSVEKLKQLNIPPAKEWIADRTRFAQAAEAASARLEEQLARMTDRQVKEKLQQEIGHDIERLRGASYFSEMYKYVSLLYPERHTLYDYMPQDTLLVIDEPARVMETAKQLERDEAEWSTHLLQNGKSLPSLELGLTADAAMGKRPFQTLFMALFLRQVPHTQPQNIVNVMCRTMQNFHGQMNVLKAEMERWKKRGRMSSFWPTEPRG